MAKSEKIISWLKGHDLISINRLETKIGMPQRTLSKAVTGLDGRDIPEKHIKALEKELRKYGYK